MELYLAGADIIGEGLPAPLNRPRAGALETFNLLGIPPRGSGYGDRYHYTDLRNLFQQEYERYFTPSYPSAALAMPETEGERLSLLNGFCTSEQPLTRSENGVIFGSLAAGPRKLIRNWWSVIITNLPSRRATPCRRSIPCSRRTARSYTCRREFGRSVRS